MLPMTEVSGAPAQTSSRHFIKFRQKARLDTRLNVAAVQLQPKIAGTTVPHHACTFEFRGALPLLSVLIISCEQGNDRKPSAHDSPGGPVRELTEFRRVPDGVVSVR